MTATIAWDAVDLRSSEVCPTAVGRSAQGNKDVVRMVTHQGQVRLVSVECCVASRNGNREVAPHGCWDVPILLAVPQVYGNRYVLKLETPRAGNDGRVQLRSAWPSPQRLADLSQEGLLHIRIGHYCAVRASLGRSQKQSRLFVGSSVKHPQERPAESRLRASELEKTVNCPSHPGDHAWLIQGREAGHDADSGEPISRRHCAHKCVGTTA